MLTYRWILSLLADLIIWGKYQKNTWLENIFQLAEEWKVIFQFHSNSHSHTLSLWPEDGPSGAESLSSNNILSSDYKTSNLPWQDNPVLPAGWTLCYHMAMSASSIVWKLSTKPSHGDATA